MFKTKYGKRGRPSKKTLARKRRNYRYRPQMAVLKTLNNKVYVFKRYTTTFTLAELIDASSTITKVGNQFRITTGAVANNNYYYSLSLQHRVDDIANSAEFTSLFDQFKLLGVRVNILPLANSVSTGDASSVHDTALIIHSCTDFDDGGAYTAGLTGVQDMQQVAGYRRQKGWSMVKRYYKPRMLSYTTVGSGGNNVLNPRAQWTNCAGSSATHYGSKYIFQIFNSSAVAVNVLFDVQMCYYVAFRGVR